MVWAVGMGGGMAGVSGAYGCMDGEVWAMGVVGLSGSGPRPFPLLGLGVQMLGNPSATMPGLDSLLLSVGVGCLGAAGG